PTALDLVMRGRALVNRQASPQTMIAARALFQQAIEHDPDNADALAGLAATFVFEVLNSYYEDGRAERLQNGKALIGRALAIDPRHIVALKIPAALFRADGEFDAAIAASQVVIAFAIGAEQRRMDLQRHDVPRVDCQSASDQRFAVLQS